MHRVIPEPRYPEAHAVCDAARARPLAHTFVDVLHRYGVRRADGALATMSVRRPPDTEQELACLAARP